MSIAFSDTAESAQTTHIGKRSGRATAFRRPTVSVVIPTLNEARNLEHVLPRRPADVHEVILVDGNSQDDTVETARRLCPDIKVIAQNRRGKGNALACGFAASTGEIIVMLDADGSTDPGEIPAFVSSLTSGADFAKGSRFVGSGCSHDITRIRMLGNRALNWLVNVLFGTRFTDLCYGYNAFWRNCLPAFGIEPGHADEPAWGDGFEIETLINVRIARAGARIAEIPSVEGRRLFGETKLHAVHDGWRVLRTIFRELRRDAPHRLAPRVTVPTQRRSSENLGSAEGGTVLWSVPMRRLSDWKLHDGGSTMSASDVSVVVACHDPKRVDLLEQCVNSALGQSVPPREVVIAVDNNPELYRRLRGEYRFRPTVHVVANLGSQGASATRNRGVLAAGGPIIAFLDDDVVADLNWLSQLIAPLADPAVVGTGGGARPRWQGAKPRWFPDEFLWAVGASYKGMPARTSAVRNVWSENMALRRAHFLACGGFLDGFGKRDDVSRPEDTEFCIRFARRSGDHWVYVPDAQVEHFVPTHRSTLGFFVRRCHSEGRGKVEMRNIGHGRLSSERSYALRTLPAALSRYTWQAVRGDGAGVLRFGAVLVGCLAAAAGALLSWWTPPRPAAEAVAPMEEQESRVG
jgi:glycosyltransferase involved in cell wall biosynthesis